MINNRLCYPCCQVCPHLDVNVVQETINADNRPAMLITIIHCVHDEVCEEYQKANTISV